MKSINLVRSKIKSFFRAAPRWLVAIVLLLLFVRAALPHLGLRGINYALAEKLGTYTGKIDDFDLELYRGSYQLQGLVIQKKDFSGPPLLQIAEIDLALAWRALFRGEISADINLKEPTISLTGSKDTSRSQTGTEEPKGHWADVFEVLIPISIESLNLGQGSISFVNQDLKEPLAVKIDQIEMQAANLRSKSRTAESPFLLTARLQEHAPVHVEGKLNVLSAPARADLDFQLKGFRLTSVNKLLLTYLPLDITKGELDLYGEVAEANAEALGYVKFFLKDGDIVASKQKILGVKHFFIEILSAFGNWILKNNETKTVAGKIPFHYKNGTLDVNSSEAFWSAVKNLNDELPRKIDRTISLQNLVRKEKSQTLKEN